MQEPVASPPTQGQILPETPPEEPSKLVQFLQCWLLYRLPTGFAWIWLLTTYSWISIPIDQWIVNYAAVSYPVVLALFLVSGRWSRAFGYPLYLLFFPCVVVAMPVVFLVQLLTNSRAAKRASKGFVDLFVFLRSFKFILILVVVNIGFWFAAGFAEAANKPFLTLVAHIVTYLLFLQSFRWAANPYKPVIAALEWLSTNGTKIVYKLLIEPNLKKKPQERASAYAACQQVELG